MNKRTLLHQNVKINVLLKQQYFLKVLMKKIKYQQLVVKR